MKLIFKSDGGFRSIPDEELAAATADGWVDGQAIWDTSMAAKRKDAAKSDVVTLEAIAKVHEPDTLHAQSEVQAVKRAPGRPRKEVPSVLNDGEV